MSKSFFERVSDLSKGLPETETSKLVLTILLRLSLSYTKSRQTPSSW